MIPLQGIRGALTFPTFQMSKPSNTSSTPGTKSDGTNPQSRFIQPPLALDPILVDIHIQTPTQTDVPRRDEKESGERLLLYF
jgi:hypothetical protein